MTREEAKELLPVIQAYAEGKTIEVKIGEYWKDLVDGPNLLCGAYECRVKPEPKYRPFKNKDECWQEMLKHQHFGWVRSAISDDLYLIESISDEIYYNRTFIPYNYAFKWVKFADGEPFGIKE